MKTPKFRTLILIIINVVSTLIAFLTTLVPAAVAEKNNKIVQPPRNHRDNDRHQDTKSPNHSGDQNHHSHPTVTKTPAPSVTKPPTTTIATTPPPTTTPPPPTTRTPG